MPTTLVIILVIFAIIMLFLNEIKKYSTQIMEIKGAILLVPMLLSSLLVYLLDIRFVWFLYSLREYLQALISGLGARMPYPQVTYPIILILFLTLSAVVPVWLIDFYLDKKKKLPFAHPYILSSVIWVVVTMLLLIRFS